MGGDSVAFGPIIAILRANRVLFALVAGLLVVSGAHILIVSAGYYFFSDDLLNFIVLREMGGTWRYYLRDFTGEFVPLIRAANLIYFRWFGLSFLPFRLLLVAYQWSVILLVMAMGLRNRVRIEILAPALVLVAVSPIFATPYQWWSAALNVCGGGLASLAAIAVLSRPGTLSRSRQLAGCLLFLVGLLLYPKGLTVAVLLFAIRVFVAAATEPKLGRAAILRALAELWPIVALSFVYVAIVVFGHYRSGAARPGHRLFFAYIWQGLSHGFSPGVLGLGGRFAGSDILANILIAGFAAAAIIRRPRTWILWAGFGAYLIISLALIALNRAALLGLESATTPRYFADMLIFFAAISMLAYAGSENRAAARPPWRTGAILAGSAIGAAFLVASASRVPMIWDRPWRVQQFIARSEASLAQSPPQAKVADTPVPDWVMPQWTWPNSQMSSFMRILKNRRPVVSPENADWRFDDQGDLIRMDEGLLPQRLIVQHPADAAAAHASKQTVCSLNRVNGRETERGVAAAVSPLRITGWGVFDTSARLEPDQISLALQAADGTIYAVQAMSVDRPDVAAVYGLARADHAGFATIAKISALPAGDYRVLLLLRAASDQRICTTASVLRIARE